MKCWSGARQCLLCFQICAMMIRREIGELIDLAREHAGGCCGQVPIGGKSDYKSIQSSSS